MSLKVFRRMGTLLISTSLFGLLSACFPNPLKTAKPNVAARFLLHASRAAEKGLKLTEYRFYYAPGGYYYRDCMNEKENKDLCNKLYQGMVEYAKTTKYFSSLSVADLTDKTVFLSLEDDYERDRFNGA